MRATAILSTLLHLMHLPLSVRQPETAAEVTAGAPAQVFATLRLTRHRHRRGMPAASQQPAEAGGAATANQNHTRLISRPKILVRILGGGLAGTAQQLEEHCA